MDNNTVSNAFQTFFKEAPEQAKAWMEAVQKLDSASRLDSKTEELAYIAVLASARMESGIPFHAKHAKELGAIRDENNQCCVGGASCSRQCGYFITANCY